MTSWFGSQQIFLFSKASRMALRPIQPPIQWVPLALSPRVMWPSRETDLPSPSSTVWRYSSVSRYSIVASTGTTYLQLLVFVQYGINVEIEFQFNVQCGINVDIEFQFNVQYGINVENEFQFNVQYGINVEIEFQFNVQYGINVEIEFQFNVQYGINVEIEFQFNVEYGINVEIEFQFNVHQDFFLSNQPDALTYPKFILL